MTSTEMKLTHISFAVDDAGVATILMDRQGDSMNTLGPELAGDLFSLLDRLETDPAIKAVVIGSAKPNNFLAGADIRWLRQLSDAADSVGLLAEAHKAFRRLEELTTKHAKPVVAAVSGHARR